MNGLLGDSKDLRSAFGGEPAFPTTELYVSPVGSEHNQYIPGLTKLEYFTISLMAGSMGAPLSETVTTAHIQLRNRAQDAVAGARVLLQELERAALPGEKV